MSNINLNKNELRRLSDFFENDKKENNYYVYALCNDGVPFYVGKGIGTRCLQHEVSLNEQLKDYENEQKGKKTEEIEYLKESLEKELSLKSKEIAAARKNESFNIIIVKYGLSEHEAFMVESAVINVIEFCGIKLTNIVNGHASQKEKKTGELIKARYIDELLIDCCPPVIGLDDIIDILNSSNIPFNKNSDDIAFINYNGSYPYCENEIDIWDAVRGCWRIDEKKGKSTKYIFAMHNNIINGIFKVKKDSEIYADFEKIYSATINLVPIKGSNVYEYKTKRDIKIIDKVIKLLSQTPSLKRNASGIAVIIGGKKSFYERGYFKCDINDFTLDKDLIILRERFLNCCIDKNQLKMPQGSVKFLFRSVISKGKKIN